MTYHRYLPKKDLETKNILRKVTSSNRALSQLNGAITNLRNPQLFLDTIHLQEVKASSEIENIMLVIPLHVNANGCESDWPFVLRLSKTCTVGKHLCNTQIDPILLPLPCFGS